MKKYITMMAGVLGLVLLLAGCAAIKGQYGSIVLDETARKSFESFKMDPSMNYYYSGGDSQPSAIIGLKKEYALDNDLWKKVKRNDERFAYQVRGMQLRAAELSMTQYGFVMKDDQGRPIGIWYSVLSVETRLLKMGKGNKVIVYTPELEVYPIRHAK